MTLNGKEYTKEFLEQLLQDVAQIVDYIDTDIANYNFDEQACDIEGYAIFKNKYLNL